PYCQTPNAKKSLFCHHCGKRIAHHCPQCARRIPSDFEFCNYCGYAQSAPGAEAIAQRNVPTPALSEKRVAPATQTPTPPQRTPSAPAPAGFRRTDSPPPVAAPAQTAETETSLARYMPAELLNKLDVARVKGEMVGERRVVTMLFCDVKGSTAAADKLDPEDWTEIMNGAFEHMIKSIYDYEGTVARLMGDAVLA